MENSNNSIERPEGRFARNFKVVVDVDSLPAKMDVQTFVKICDSGFIFYDSSKGNRPKLYETGSSSGEDVVMPIFVDSKGQEVDIDDFNKKLADEEFWRKELYNCKQSPLYYFTNYISSEPKPSQASIDAFLKENGFGAKSDSEEAALTTEDIKKVRDEFSKTITLEKLKDMKPVRDSIDAEYEVITSEITKRAAEAFGLSETHESKIVEKIVTAIMKVKPNDAHEDLKYYILPHSGRWDKNLLRATDIDVLLRLWEKTV